jgi:anthranilate synthase/aminodeoxychorismate synthase-like glutamine amidotransferase
MILMIDNYDSFTYNLVQYLGELGEKLAVFRNNKISLEAIRKFWPAKIVISPGPGGPQAAGICVELIKEFAGKIPILGVCLGHQCIGYAFGAKIKRANRLMHGKTSLIYHNRKNIFRNLPNPFTATRYHSLVISRKGLPGIFEVIAWEKQDNEIMGIKHRDYPLWGVQFHPESIMTEAGKRLLENFVKIN